MQTSDAENRCHNFRKEDVIAYLFGSSEVWNFQVSQKKNIVGTWHQVCKLLLKRQVQKELIWPYAIQFSKIMVTDSPQLRTWRWYLHRGTSSSRWGLREVSPQVRTGWQSELPVVTAPEISTFIWGVKKIL